MDGRGFQEYMWLLFGWLSHSNSPAQLQLFCRQPPWDQLQNARPFPYGILGYLMIRIASACFFEMLAVTNLQAIAASMVRHNTQGNTPKF